MFTFPVGLHKKHASSGGPVVVGANLAMWVKADAGTTTTNIGGVNVVTAWADQSGNGRNWATNPNVAVNGGSGGVKLISGAQNGLPVLRIGDGTASYGPNTPADGYWLSQPAFFTGTQQAEVFVMIKANTAGTNYAWSGFGPNAGGDSVHYTFGGTVYEHFGRTNRTTGNSISGYTSYGVYNVSSGPTGDTNYLLFLNNASLGATNTSNSPPAWGATFYLFANSITLGNNFQFFGDIGEVLVYDAPLSSGDRTTVYNYLKARWNTP